jgi:hypothetical protein
VFPQVFQKNWSDAHAMFKAKVKGIKKVGIDSKGNVVPEDADDDEATAKAESDHTGWLEAEAAAAAMGAAAADEKEAEEEPAPFETLAEKAAKLELGEARTRGGVAEEKVVEAGADGAFDL